MRIIFNFLLAVLTLLTFACTENGNNVQEFLLTAENVDSYIDEQSKIVESDQENAQANFNLARSYYFINEFEKAEHYARRATRF